LHCNLRVDSHYASGPRGNLIRSAPAAKQILSYFVRHPSAVDSLEGIARWRLLEEAIHQNILETEKALRWLVQEGYLIETLEPHSGRLFHLNREKQGEAISLLDAPERS